MSRVCQIPGLWLLDSKQTFKAFDMNNSIWSFIGNWLLLVVAGGLVSGCHKQDFLGKNPNSTLIVPSTLSDFQSLLDNDLVMNQVPALGEISGDNYYMGDDLWQTAGTRVQNAYLWKPDIFVGQGSVEDWNFPYQQVYYANVVLDGLDNIKTDNSNLATWNDIKGQALFARAFGLFNVAQLFAPVYDVASADSDPGVPLRLTEDVQARVVRSTVKQTYNQITGDLRIAAGLLSSKVLMTYVNRASRPAALAMLARVYLSMRKYDSAMFFADNALSLNLSLLDYNSLSAGAITPFPKQNAEILFQAQFVNYSSSNSQVLAYGTSSCFADSTLIRSYDSNDLRLVLYYASIGGPGVGLNGSYAGSIFPFGGLATDELYLIRAECKARTGDTSGAASDLNALLVKRWKTGKFTNLTFSSPKAALDRVLLERRKEMPFRNVRWSDLRRLNKENVSIMLTRITNGITYTLTPNDKRYVLPIPPDVLRLSGIADNPR